MALPLRRRWVVALAVVGIAVVFGRGPVAARLPGRATSSGVADTGRCWFQFDMRLLRAEIPEIIGDCLENQHYNPENGDTLQRTTGGLIVWRKTDRVVAFTDGARTWAHGPAGLEVRRNDERFEWETPPANASPVTVAKASVVGPGAAPPAASATPAPAAATATVRPVIVTTPEARLGSTLGGVAAAVIPSNNELIGAATDLYLVSSLKSSGLPVAGVQALTADNDPNQRLGKPGQYTSKIVWKDQRAPSDEATMELFPDDASMKTRLQSLEAVAKTSPSYTPYVFGQAGRKAILRLPKQFSLEQAQSYQRWLSTLR